MRLPKNRRIVEPVKLSSSEEAALVSHQISIDAQKYLHAKVCLGEIKKHIRYLSVEQFQKLRKQAIDGDTEGAYRDLHMIIMERG